MVPDLGSDEIGTVGKRLNVMGKRVKEQIVSLQRLSTERAEWSERLKQAAITEERQRLARELHDAVSQQLFAISMMTSAVQQTLSTDPAKAKQQVAMIGKAFFLWVAYVVGEADNGEEGVRLALELNPDVILMDLVMDDMDGIEATRRIIKHNPEARIIVLTSFVDDEKVYPVIEAGAMSYLLKTTRAPQIAEAIRAAYKGEPVVEAKVASKMMQRMRAGEQKLPHEEMTERELEVLRLIAEGKTNQEIAEELMIGIKTVKTHVSHILAKLNVEDRTQAAIYAHRHSLVK